MKILVFAYTQKAGLLSEKLVKALNRNNDVRGFLFHRYHNDFLEPFFEAGSIIERAFEEGISLIFVCAAGIAVRQIAPFIKDKKTDPGVVVMDEEGRYGISLCSGHLGGGNDLALICAGITGGEAVITTATDINKRFAVDIFAKNNNLVIKDMGKAKHISADILRGKKAGLYYDKSFIETHGSLPVKEGIDYSTEKNCSIMISHKKERGLEEKDKALHLVPRQIIVGIGCRRGTSFEDIRDVLTMALSEHNISLDSIERFASIDLKKDEKGLLELSEYFKVPFFTFPVKELEGVSGDFSSSEFVKEKTGVDNVCERSALLAGGQQLIIKKFSKNGVTIAAAIRKKTIVFDRKKPWIFLFGGTKEGRILTEYLEAEKKYSMVFVATRYAKDILLDNMKYCIIKEGRLNYCRMINIMTDYPVSGILDATHPYAVEVTKNIKKAALHMGIPYKRVLREQSEKVGEALYFDTIRELVLYMNDKCPEGNILLTTGSKDIIKYTDLKDYANRLYVRVLPVEENIKSVMDKGIPKSHIITGKGPFSLEDNILAIKSSKADYLISKDTSIEGGMPQKVEAARLLGVKLMIINRPNMEEGYNLEEIKNGIKRGNLWE